MNRRPYEADADAIALAIWEQSTGNGRDLPRDQWDEHMQNCHATVANAYLDGMTVAAWHAAALARLTGADAPCFFDVYANGTFWGTFPGLTAADAMQAAADAHGTADVGQERASIDGMIAVPATSEGDDK